MQLTKEIKSDNTPVSNGDLEVNKLISKKISDFFEIHKKCGTTAAGIHLEMTHKNVTECVDNDDNNLNINYERIDIPLTIHLRTMEEISIDYFT